MSFFPSNEASTVQESIPITFELLLLILQANANGSKLLPPKTPNSTTSKGLFKITKSINLKCFQK